MANTTYSQLLGFALPVTGELEMQWGDVVNGALTQLIEHAIAGTADIDVTAGATTLTTTGGGAPNQARNAILRIIGAPDAKRDVIAPAQSKSYIVVNTTGQSITVTHVLGGTGAVIAPNTTRVVSWTGAKYEQTPYIGTMGERNVIVSEDGPSGTHPAGTIWLQYEE